MQWPKQDKEWADLQSLAVTLICAMNSLLWMVTLSFGRSLQGHLAFLAKMNLGLVYAMTQMTTVKPGILSEYCHFSFMLLCRCKM